MTAAFVMTKGFREGFERFQRESGKDLHVYMKESMRLLVETCYHWTAPPTKGNRGSRGGRKGGQAIIARDIYWMTAAVSQKYLDVLHNAFGSVEIPMSEFRRKDGTTYLIENVIVNVDGSPDMTTRYHRERRHANGRVLTHADRTTQDIGRWSPRNKMLMTKEARDKYIKDTQRRVGKLKGGWSYALDQLDSKLPPGWVGSAGNMNGHSGIQPSGGFEDAILPEQWSGSMTAINRVSYFRDPEGFMARAHKHVERFMERGGKPLEGFLDRMIKRHTEVK